MVFKLSNIIDLANPHDVFRLYDEYVRKNQSRFPKSVLALLNNDDWEGGSNSKAPYYSHLENFEIQNYGKADASFRIKLNKNMYVEKPLSIEITYKGLLSVDIPKQVILPNCSDTELMIWRYNEFLFYDGYHDYGIKDTMFTHNIEWIDGQVWSIIARDVEVNWLDL